MSFEFRHNSATARRRWDLVFAGGSLVAALARGLIVGGLIQGVDTDLDAFGLAEARSTRSVRFAF